MSFGNTTENDVVAFLFNATALSGNWPSSGGNFYVALYTADPGEAGTAITNETAYTNYARVAITRNSTGFTVSGNTASNTSTVTFPTCGATGATITHFGIVSSSSGAGQLFGSGALNSSISVTNGISPQFLAGVLTITID